MRRVKTYGDECPYCYKRAPDWSDNKCPHCGGALESHKYADMWGWTACVIGVVGGFLYLASDTAWASNFDSDQKVVAVLAFCAFWGVNGLFWGRLLGSNLD